MNFYGLMAGVLYFLCITSVAGAQSISISGAVTQKKLKESETRLPPPSITVKAKEAPSKDKSVKPGTENNPIKRTGQFITMNFESAPIREVIKAICELEGMNYIIEDAVKGFVTIRTIKKIPIQSTLELLDQLLTLNNLTRVKVGDYWRFLASSNVIRQPLSIYSDPSFNDISEQNRYHIYLISLDYVAADKILELIKPFLSKSGKSIILPRSNMLLLVEQGVHMQNILNLVKVIDIDSLDKMQVKLFELKEAEAKDVSLELESIFSAMGYKKGEAAGVTFLPLARLNSILVVNPFPSLYPTIRSWVEKLDTDFVPVLETAEITTFIYHVQNGNASTLAGILQSLYSVDIKKQFEKADIEVVEPGKRPVQPAATETKKNDKAGQTGKTGKTTKPAAQAAPLIPPSRAMDANILGPVQIVAHSSSNSIIIRTAKKNYSAILDTLKKLDVMPQQVLIEVLIAELTMEGDFEFGLEWALQSGGSTSISQNFGGIGSSGSVSGNLSDSSYNPLGQSGISIFSRPTGDIMGLLHALATENKLEVRANPVILTRDNKAASIDITTDIPIRTTTTTDTGSTENVEYKSVGIILKVTPNISRDGFVALELDQEYSDVLPKEDGATDAGIARRQAITSMVVKNRETLIIGGLIQKTSRTTDSGLPFLSKIPVLGWLFGTKSDSTIDTEILLFITPNIVNNPEEARDITAEFRKKINDLKLSVLTSKDESNGKETGEKTIMSN